MLNKQGFIILYFSICCISIIDARRQLTEFLPDARNCTNSPTISPTQLPDKFILPNPQCGADDESVGDEGMNNTMKCSFTGIIIPDDGYVSMQIRGDDCISDYDSSIFNGTVITALTDSERGVRTFNAIANVDASSGYEGDVKFCIRTTLTNKFGTEMIYRGEKMSLTLKYDGGFVGVSVGTVINSNSTTRRRSLVDCYGSIGEVVTNADVTFSVTAMICDETGIPVLSPTPLSLGQNLYVCIEPKSLGLKIPFMTYFNAQKKGSDSDDDRYDILNSGANIIQTGYGTSFVQLGFVLPSRFFDEAIDINIFGSVALVPDTRRRLRKSRDDPRNVEFALVVSVEAAVGSKDKVYRKKSSAPRLAMMLYTVIFGIAALLFT